MNKKELLFFISHIVSIVALIQILRIFYFIFCYGIYQAIEPNLIILFFEVIVIICVIPLVIYDIFKRQLDKDLKGE